jgi:hypothetical protein
MHQMAAQDDSGGGAPAVAITGLLEEGSDGESSPGRDYETQWRHETAEEEEEEEQRVRGEGKILHVAS